MNADERRSARLLLGAELAAGVITEADIERPEVARAVGPGRIPGLPRRLLQRLAMKAGLLGYRKHCAAPFMRARRAVLGERAEGAPRILVRVDEFPHAGSFDHSTQYGPDAYARFHSIMATAGVPYLIAVIPRVSRNYLDPGGTGGRPLDSRERELLRTLCRERVAVALHGYDHRTRDSRPRHRSELSGLGASELAASLDGAEAELAELCARPRVFVPPFNRFERGQYDLLAGRYEVVCGGPETVPIMGFQPTPVWRGEAVYLPAYPPLYGRSAAILEAVVPLIELRMALWVPIVLHWGWEVDDGFRDVERLAHRIAPYAASWQDFLSAVETSGQPGSSEPAG